jgi:hypothetical protein
MCTLLRLSWLIYYCPIKHSGLDWRELRLVWSGDHHGQADWPPAEILDLLHVMAAVQVIR